MFNVLTFGELLYDVYNDVSVIGGAPFNYSIQLSRLLNNDDKLKFITSLGNDELANNAMDFIKKENIDSSLIQINNNYNTGKATVFLNEKKVPDYIIHENAAWDNIFHLFSSCFCKSSRKRSFLAAASFDRRVEGFMSKISPSSAAL